MSFFNSLQQYVTTGVAQLGLSPRRSSRPDAQEPQEPTPATVLAPHPTTALHGEYKIIFMSLEILRRKRKVMVVDLLAVFRPNNSMSLEILRRKRKVLVVDLLAVFRPRKLVLCKLMAVKDLRYSFFRTYNKFHF